MKVVEIDDGLIFDNGWKLSSYHDSDCCEWHYLDFEHLNLDDFKDLEFDLTSDNFFGKIPDYGIELKPIKGWAVKIPGYGNNNGYYSTNLTLVVKDDNCDVVKKYDIKECQVIYD